MKQILLASVLFVFLFQSCKKDGLPEVSVSGTFKGEPVTMGNGKVNSWIEVGSDGQPRTVGITFEEAAFTNLPAGDEHTEEYEYEPALPLEKELTPFSHLIQPRHSAALAMEQRWLLPHEIELY